MYGRTGNWSPSGVEWCDVGKAMRSRLYQAEVYENSNVVDDTLRRLIGRWIAEGGWPPWIDRSDGYYPPIKETAQGQWSV